MACTTPLSFLLAGIGISTAAFAAQPLSWQAEMHGQRFSAGQAATPDQAILTVPAKQTLLLRSDGWLRLETRTTFPGEIVFNNLLIAQPTGLQIVDLLKWRQGLEKDQQDSAAASQLFSDALLFSPPVLQQLAPAKAGVVTQIWQDKAGRKVTLQYAASGQLTGASLADQDYRYQPLTDDQWQVRHFRQGTEVASWQGRWRQVPQINENAWQLPAGYQPKKTAGPLRVEVVAPGIWRVNGSPSGYHSHFVAGQTGIAVFDAPVNPAEATAVLALIRQTLPDLPVQHVVLSHTHRDHVGGLPVYLAAGARIWTGKDGVVALKRQFGDDVAVKTTELTQRIRLDLGKIKLDVWPLPTPHAAEGLVAYHADSGTLLQGDLYAIPEVGAAPPAFAISASLQQWLVQQQIPAQRFLSSHGRIATAADFRRSLQLAKKPWIPG